jgi:hypothetical protein
MPQKIATQPAPPRGPKSPCNVPTDGLVSVGEAARALGTTAYRAMFMALNGHMDVVARPGQAPLLTKSSVERLADQRANAAAAARIGG